MADISAVSVPRPRLAFRVGVTGARALAPNVVGRLRPLVADVLSLIAREMTRFAENPVAKPVYSAAAAGPVPSTLRLLSPLAEGSDRLVAEEALKAGYALHAPLPFPQGEYEKDFPQSVDAFRTLLARAEVLELDGGRGALEPESYREIGCFVVRNCDLLIAIWDGDRERGIGGTAEIVRFAVATRVPVWWIDANGANPPRFIDDPLKLRKPSLADSGENAAKGVIQYLERTILPPRFVDAEHSGIFGFVAYLLGHLFARDGSPLIDYLGEKPHASSFPWRAYARLMEVVLPKSAGRRIGQFGEICFMLTAGAGSWKVYSLFRSHTTAIAWSTMLGACFSAASGAFVGVRAYSEFPLFVQQSTHMLRILKEASAELGAIEIDQPLASRELGRTMHGLAISMMQDVSGWMQLFRIKALEAG